MHRRTLLQSKVHIINWPKKTSRALLIFVESGVLYTVLWVSAVGICDISELITSASCSTAFQTCIVVASLSIAHESGTLDTPSTGMITFYTSVINLKESALVNLIVSILSFCNWLGLTI